MKPEVMDKLREARDFYALTKGVLALCEPFGPVHAFRLVHNRGASRVACFIELESLKQQPALARALGCRTLNGAVCLEVPVNREFPSEAKVVALPATAPVALDRIAAGGLPLLTRVAAAPSPSGR
jgi:hypothetical protein